MSNETINWIPTLISKYQQTLEVLSNKDFTRLEAVEYLKSLNLDSGVCKYLEKEGLVHAAKVECITVEGNTKSSLVYMQLQDYMQKYCQKPYFTVLPSLCYSTEQVKTSIKTRLQHLHKMAELYKQA